MNERSDDTGEEARLGLLLACLLALPAFGLGACGSGETAPTGPRLVILYATCTLNRDYLSPYGAEAELTPHLARFAEQSLVFERHTTEAGHSGSAFASIFSGTNADRHGILYHPCYLPDDLYLAAEAFADHGYDTYFWSGHRMASASLNYGQGIPEENVIVSPLDEQNKPVRTGGGPRFQEILDRLGSDPDYRAFIQVNFTVTHAPYHKSSPPAITEEYCRRFPGERAGLTGREIERYVGIYNRNRFELQYDFPNTVEKLGLSPDEVATLARVLDLLYRSSVHQLDTYFGAYLESIDRAGLTDDCLLAFTADHGEVLYRENALFQWTHGQQLAPENLDVPLMIRAPQLGIEPGTYEAVTRSIDVFPTLAGLCGIPIPAEAGVRGQDLSPAILGERAPPDLPAYSYTTILSPLRWEEAQTWELFSTYFPRMDPELIWVRIREQDLVYKWRRMADGAWGTQVFDLAADPDEREDLYDSSVPEHVEMTRRLQGFQSRLVEAYELRRAGKEVPVDEALQRLKDTGYAR